MGWRKDGLRYKKNEIFLDVIETVNMLMSAQGRWAGQAAVGESQPGGVGAWGVELGARLEALLLVSSGSAPFVLWFPSVR